MNVWFDREQGFLFSFSNIRFDFNEGAWWHPCHFILVPWYNFSQKEIRIMIIFIVMPREFSATWLIGNHIIAFGWIKSATGRGLDWLWWVYGAYRRRTTGDGADHPPPPSLIDWPPISYYPASRRIPSHSILSRRIPSYSILSRRIPSHSITSRRIPSHSITSSRIPSHFMLSHRIPSQPISFHHRIRSHPIAFHHIQSHFILSHHIPSPSTISH